MNHAKQPRLNPSEAELRASLMEVKKQVSLQEDEIPFGWVNKEYLQKLWHLESSQTGRNIREAIKAGILQEKKFRVFTGKKIYPTPYYKSVK